MHEVIKVLKDVFKRKRAASLAEFSYHVLAEQCDEVEIIPMHRNKGLIGVAGVSLGAFCSLRGDDGIREEYYLRYLAVIPSGGRIVYDGMHRERNVPLDEAPYDHKKEAVRVFLDAEKAAVTLRSKAKFRVQVALEPGMPIDAARRRELYADAEKYGLVPRK